MERRIKVWLITLVVLLVAALFSTVFFKLELDKNRKQLNSSEIVKQNMNTELDELTSQMETDEAEAVATIAYLESAVADYEAQVDKLNADIEEKDEYIAELETARAESEAQAEAGKSGDIRVNLDTAAARVSALETGFSEVVENLENAGDTEKSAEFAAALEKVAGLKTALDDAAAKLEDGESDGETVNAVVEEVNSGADELEGELEEAQAVYSAEALRMAELETSLEEATAAAEAAQQRADELETMLEEQLSAEQDTVSDERVSELQTELEEAEALYESASAELAAANEELAAANEELDAANEELAAANEELVAANEELAAANAELDTYRAAHRETPVEKHASAEMDAEVNVLSDGITAEYVFFNNDTSGNSVVFSLLLDEDELYVSDAISPGEGFEGFSLERAVDAGEYEACVCISTLNSDGEVISNLRLPVALCVAE